MTAKNISKVLCEVFCFNKKKVNEIKKSLVSEEKINALVEIFKVISDKTRAKILFALKDNELCVCDISHVLGMSISSVSHQLRILRNLKLVTYRNEGKIVFYSLSDKFIIKLLDEGIIHINENRRLSL